MLRAPEMGYIEFYPESAVVNFRSPTSNYSALCVEIRCTAPEWQVSFTDQVCTSSLPPVSTAEDLYILANRRGPYWGGGVENALWLELLHPFTAVKNLYLRERLVRYIVPALQELVEGSTIEVLPTLDNIFLEGFWPSGPNHRGIEDFDAARRLTSRPVKVSGWDGKEL